MKRALFKVIMLILKIISIVIESLSALYQETFGQKVQKKKYITSGHFVRRWCSQDRVALIVSEKEAFMICKKVFQTIMPVISSVKVVENK
ncbi:hypothetical protein [Lachnoanaerobaculum gingivalis]|uniref:hypothetical protein n=1 Tax=Lachnoanaerobaculum gingivalis TaxID=2490855 RepID=UPI0028D549E2|nr:hypothetical protein [Lachnoanaerobaculum gingivalis]